MADNYLENRYDELFGSGKKKVVVKHIGQSLDNLLLKNRSHRGYQKERIVTAEELRKIVSVNTKIASGCNQQLLRFKLVSKGKVSNELMGLLRLGRALPELNLPFPGTEPEAFIVVCSIAPENKLINIDLGISAQSMLLKAVEIGLNGLIIAAFNKEKVRELLTLPYDPLLVIAIGKGAENIKLVEIDAEESHNYYREKDVHYVPKVKLDHLIIAD